MDLDAMLARAALTIALCFAGGSFADLRAATCTYSRAEDLGRDVAAHFVARTLDHLARRLPARPVTIHVEHSLADDLSFSARVPAARVEARLARAETAEPRQAARLRGVLDGMQCQGLTCRFGPSGILHNTLYLQSVSFVRTGGCLAIARIALLDGD
ncbi:hypothetical protein [Phreatobacter stygius]|uniref:Uncharacterized protein n=1 Tax=Phreatobacter stygius TaxID=1940610 RepID=A0A4D7AZB3_9HYPH|nr:hypothetical protein [Phreatobacter stygius]QCI66689.1 hypothetical protein E8M01_22095 [Phreatobacter stygius]